jgi:hypothetical protein
MRAHIFATLLLMALAVVGAMLAASIVTGAFRAVQP